MLSRFFIDRPIFAAVLSIVITLAGAIALRGLPLAMFPSITPPTVQVDCTFPGASAEVVSQAIATPIEQQVNGVEGMLYMSSQCTNDGAYSLSVTFKHGVNLHLAQVLVQNRVNLALPSLPDSVKQAGVTTRKKSPDILMTVNIFAPTGRYDQLYLSNYATLRVRDELARIDGVSDVSVFGQRDYSMRIWLNPERIAYLNLTAGDIVKALREQNLQVAAGQIGQEPMPTEQVSQVPLRTLGRLREIEQFENVIIKSAEDGRIVRLKDVARVTLSAKNEAQTLRIDTRPSIGLPIFQLPDANALETADRVIAKMKELKKEFPEGIDYQFSYDTTQYTRESIREVFKSLFDAVILVAFVVLLFLQNWRSAIIPLIAVPVAIVGTFAVMAVMGFSLNNLTLFGLVLAIGIVVDDAIVVVEAVERHIEHGLSPRQATIKAMEQVSGPVIAVGLVLSAVFVPCAFIGGMTGQFFRQFALTIAVSTIISAFNSLTLSPALAAILLKPRRQGTYDTLPRIGFVLIGGWLAWHYLTRLGAFGLARLPEDTVPSWASLALPWAMAALGAFAGWLFGRPLNWLFGFLFALFNQAFGWGTGIYTHMVGYALRGSAIIIVLYVGLIGLTSWTFNQLPRGFIPAQDMGYLTINVQLPDAASIERTRKVMNQVEEITFSTKGVKHTSAMSGNSYLLNASGSNVGSVFVLLDDFKDRQTPELYVDEIIKGLRVRFQKEVQDATVSVFSPPPMRGVGRAGGFKMMIEARGDQTPAFLQAQVDEIVDRASRKQAVAGALTVFRANVPQLYVDVNRAEAMSMQVPLKDTFESMQVYLGSLYVNDFNLHGRTWQVIVQADAGHRDQMEDVRRLRVRSARGDMVPLGAIASVQEVNGPLVLTRHNMYPAAAITGSAGDGYSSGEALDFMKQLADRQLPDKMSFEWSEMSYLEATADNTAMVLFTYAVLMVFLVLAAQYESWSLPLAVILVVPMCILCALAGVAIARKDINVFTQIGFVVLVGLASKNAILIVEFAKQLREMGMGRSEATLVACQLRLRPIVMTSLAFILGVVPLLIAHGAGAEMRRTLGIAVFSGMLGVTIFGLFLTPVFFYLIDALSATRLFASSVMRVIGTVSLYLVGLVFFGVIGFMSFRWLGLLAFEAGWVLLLMLGYALRRR